MIAEVLDAAAVLAYKQRLIDYLAAGLERAPWAVGAGAGR